MISNKMAVILILASCGFLVWYLYGRDIKSTIQKALPTKEVKQTAEGQPADQSKTGEDQRAKEPVAAENETEITHQQPQRAETPDDNIGGDDKSQSEAGLQPEKAKIPEERVTVAVEGGDGATWGRFRERYMPGYHGKLTTIFGYEVALEVDWNSLGNLEKNPRLAENLVWDLNTLVKALSDPLNSKADSGGRTEKNKVREDIEHIRLRRVKGLENRRLEVVDHVMQMDLCWERYGSFSSFDIETLLLDRDRTRFSSQVNEPEVELPPLMIETCRNRLPPLFRHLNVALGAVIPVQMDWPGLTTAPDAAHRLVHMLGTLNKTVKDLVNTGPGFGPYSKRERNLKQQRDDQRSAMVKNNLKTLTIRGGSYRTDPVTLFNEGALELVVFQDKDYIRNPDADKDKQRAVSDIRRFPGCNRRSLKKQFVDKLNLEVGPALQQARVVHFPITQAYLPEFLNEQIAKARLPVPDAVVLREFLNTHPMTLEMDWDSLTAPEKSEDRMTSIRKVETGKYNYNDKYGELFRDFFHGVAEAVRKDKSFLERFIHTVRKVRYEQIPDPEFKELYSGGSTIVLRQCLYRQKGTFDYETLSKKLSVEVAAMAHAPSQEEMAAIVDLDECLAGLEETLEIAGVQIGITTDGALSEDPETVEATCRRMLIPLNGALRYLLKQPGYPPVFREQIQAIQFRKTVSSGKKGCTFQDGVLVCAGLPGKGVKGWLQGDELALAVDDAMALKVRADILQLEKSRASRRTNSLKKHDWDVAVEVDWESFISHPEQGGNRLYPIYVEQYGTERLIYALSGWMEDETFKIRVMQRIDMIRVTGAANLQSSSLSIENNTLVYRCFADISAKGYLSMDSLQQELYRLIIK